MTLYYAKSTGGFYDDGVHAEGQMPADKVEITPEEHAALLAGQADGKVIVADSSGSPALADPPPPPLTVYANRKQWALATGGYTLTVSGSARTIPSDAASAAFIGAKLQRLSQPNPPATIKWQCADGAFVSIAAADFAPMAVAIADFVQATFDALDAVFAAIAAGTITTTAEVDAAAWPASHD